MWRYEQTRFGLEYTNESADAATVTDVEVLPATATHNVRLSVVRIDATPVESDAKAPLVVDSGMRLIIHVTEDEQFEDEETVESVTFTYLDERGRSSVEHAY